MKYPRTIRTEKGYRFTYLYQKFHMMKCRCFNKNFTAYKNYGARGIGVESWLLDFDNYVEYLIEILPEGKTIEDMQRLRYTVDRINNEGNYERGNLRWASIERQNQNRRKFKNNKSGYRGVSWDKNCKKYKTYIRVVGKYKHLGCYNTPEEAFAVYCKAYLKYFGQEEYEHILSQHPHWDATTNTRKEAA
jgi:hypothetical protein